MWDELQELVAELASEDRDELIDQMQEEVLFEELCKHLWVLELVVAICKART